MATYDWLSEPFQKYDHYTSGAKNSSILRRYMKTENTLITCAYIDETKM